LFLVFAMTAQPVRAQWYHRIPPPVWMLLLFLDAYCVQNTYAWADRVHFRSLLLAVVIALAGLALAVWGERTFHAAGTEVLPASATNRMVVTTGPFRFTRNPMYAGVVLIALGIAVYVGTLPFYAVPALLFLLCNYAFIPFEEAKMQTQHGTLYTEYLSRVRRWI
jgi:protein-S-isoprenylcysteine O-methyltransferase Ste14